MGVVRGSREAQLERELAELRLSKPDAEGWARLHEWFADIAEFWGKPPAVIAELARSLARTRSIAIVETHDGTALLLRVLPPPLAGYECGAILRIAPDPATAAPTDGASVEFYALQDVAGGG